MILYGSTTSPYVRRIRMLLDQTDYDFQIVNIYDDQVRSQFSQLSPIKKLPVLRDGDSIIYDSHVIAQFVIDKQGLPKPDLQTLNLVSVVDAITDALIILFMGQRSGIETDSDKLIFKLQHGRIPSCLDWLAEKAKEGAFNKWSYACVALISLIDWAEFRSLYDFTNWPELTQAAKQYAQQPIVVKTYPVA